MNPLRPTTRRLILTLLLLTLAAGCGSPDKSEIKVAEVGDRVITLDFFERKMNTMDPKFLPADIATREGRLELLEVMVNKEVMALKAEELGYAADGTVDRSASAMAEMKAVEAMRNDITKDNTFVSDEEVFDYYENLSRKLNVSYMLFDHEEDALAAKGLVEGGEQWRTVAMRKSSASPGDNADYTMNMTYGTLADDLEEIVFNLPVGVVSPPIETVYGYFLIRVEGQQVERVPPLDNIRDRVLASIIKQKNALLVKDFIEQVFDEYGFVIHEDVLQKLFDALPAQDPSISPPAPREDLEPLNLEPADFDLELCRWGDDVWTLRRYYDFYNESGALARPRRERLLGGLRRSLKEMAIRELMPIAARDRGYMDRPEVQDEYKERREQAMVTQLHQELIRDVVRVTPEDTEAYWAEHAADFIQPERRDTLALVAESEELAREARNRALVGREWPALIEEYCVDGEVKQKQGRMGRLSTDDIGLYGEMVFQLAGEGEVSEPRQIDENQWLIVMCETVHPYTEPTLEQAGSRVARIVQAQKEEELFQQRVEEWKSEMVIQRYPENLDKAVYDPQPQPDSRLNIMPGALQGS